MVDEVYLLFHFNILKSFLYLQENIVRNLITYKRNGPDYSIVKNVKQSHYRPRVAQRVLRNLRFPDFVTTAQDGVKVVSLTHRPPLPPGIIPGTHFC